MTREAFSASAPGRLVRIPGDRPDTLHAFIPNPAPPRWEWPVRLWPKLLEAHKRLASLDGTGKHLPNPEILLTPLQQREAQLSSQLEGTITEPHQQVLFHANPRYPTSDEDPINAYREVYNYAKALRLRLGGSSDLPLSLRLIRNLHLALMDGVRGAWQTPGEFRTTQNQIGQPARFVPPPPQHLSETLDELEKYLHAEDDELDPLVRAFVTHYQFETIHPFRDGNGRVGRLLLALCIAEWCGLSSQWPYMSAFFERRKQDYMDLMLRVSTHGDWESWIEFCLDGVIAQAQDTELRCDQLLALHRDFHTRINRIKGGSVRLAALVDLLFERPVVTVTGWRIQSAVTYPTAKADLSKLERLGIVARLDRMPVATYFCPEIYRVTYDDVETS